MITKENIIDSFQRELIRQQSKKVFIEKELVKYTSSNVLYGLSEEDKLYVISNINKSINKYCIKYYTINNIYQSSTISNYINKSINYYSFININLSSITSLSTPILSNELIDNEEDSDNIEINFPTFIRSSNQIHLPKKIEYLFDNFIDKKDLLTIDKDIQTAKEMCYVTISLIATLDYTRETKLDWIHISKNTFISNIFGKPNKSTHPKIIKRILDVLKYGTDKKGSIIECNNEYIPGELSMGYRLSENYSNKGMKVYDLTSTKVCNGRRKHYYIQLSRRNDNIIVKNLMNVYGQIDLPSEETIIREAKRLINLKGKDKYKTKKGKILKFRNKKSVSLDDTDKYSYVEDNIEMFKYLTEIGYILPTISEEKAGGRVSDSFTLMPSWIRKLCKINNRKIVESDYTCLHPNIAMKMYGGNMKFLTHKQVSDMTGIDEMKVKVEHLSFFNRSISDMKKRVLYDFYMKQEPTMMNNILQEKLLFGYRETSKKLFKMEVSIMTEVIRQLNSERIYVMYVYDALECSPKDLDRVTEIMNDVIQSYKIYTRVK